MLARLAATVGAGLVIALPLLFLSADPLRADGVGITPAIIDIKDAMRGATITRMLTIVSNEDEELTFEFARDGEVGNWASFYSPDNQDTPLERITVPPREQGHVLLRIVIPADAANGPREGFVGAKTVPSEGSGAGAAVGVAVSLDIHVMIDVTGTQNLAGTVRDVTALDAEVGYPLRIEMTFENTGNVEALPTTWLQVKDTAGALVAEERYDGETVALGAVRTLRSEWDTTGRQPGDYVANVAVTLQDNEIDRRTLPFKILPVGALTRQGVLEGLTLDNQPSAGGIAKMTAHFQNIGQIGTRATFVGEVYFGPDLVDTISSRELLVEMRESAALEVFADVAQAGTYTVKGKVNYEGKETETKEVVFAVPLPSPAGGGGPSSLWMATGGGILALAVVLSGGLALRSRLRPAARAAESAAGQNTRAATARRRKGKRAKGSRSLLAKAIGATVRWSLRRGHSK